MFHKPHAIKKPLLVKAYECYTAETARGESQMAHVVYDDYPKLANSILVAAFSGWPDSQQASSRALHYVLRQLPASKFAEIDPEEFYVFSRIRPLSQPAADDTDNLQWPSNKFYSWKNKRDKKSRIANEYRTETYSDGNSHWAAYRS